MTWTELVAFAGGGVALRRPGSIKSKGEMLLLALMPPQPATKTASIAQPANWTSFRCVVTMGEV